MKHLKILALCALTSVSLPAAIVTFDFESSSISSGLTTLSVSSGGVTATITRVGGSIFGISDISGSTPAFGSRSLDPFGAVGGGAFVVDFSALLSSISVAMGDFAPSDIDTLTISAYSGVGGSGTLLGTSSVVLANSPTGFNFATVSTGGASIMSIVMNGGSSSFPNSVYYDFLTVDTGTPGVPDAGSTAGLLFLAVAGLAALRRKL